MKKIYFLFVLNCWVIFSFAQQFTALDKGFIGEVRCLSPDTVNNILYAGGTFQHLGNGIPDIGISTWNGTTWDTTIATQILCLVTSLTGYNGGIYTGGGCNYYIGGGNWVTGLGIWNGTSYNVISLPTSNDAVFGFYQEQNDLYILGLLDSVNHVDCDDIIRYDGTNWYSYPSLGLYPNGNLMGAAAIYQNELYVGGNFWNAGLNIACFAKFNGTSWQRVGNWPAAGGLLSVGSLKVWNGQLYIGGYFTTSMGTVSDFIVSWDGTNFHSLGLGLYGVVFGMEVFNNELYVAGSFTASGSQNLPYLAKWDGNAWHSIGIFDQVTDCFAVMNNKLYIGGGFTTVNGDTMNSITEYDPAAVGLPEQNQNYTEVYPNPFDNALHIASAGERIQKVRLSDASGKIVLEKNVDFSIGLENNFFELNLSNLKPGVYSLVLFRSSGIENRRVVKI